MYLTVLLYTVLFNFISLPLEGYIFDFFDIEYSMYGIYFLWLRGLSIFNSLLPARQSSIFE